jgi:transcriptional regulator GlxA family with amidase domain
MHKIAVLALDEAIVLDLAIPTQVFGLARLPGGERAYEVRVCGPRRSTICSGDLPRFQMSAPWPLKEAVTAHTIVVPGVADTDRMPSQRAITVLRTAARRGARIASVCTGAFVLAAAGLLDGHRATTHWEDAAALARRYPAIDVDPNVLYVDNGGRLLTSAGLAAGLDMCLHMVGADYGAAVAAATARRVVVPLVRAGGQAQFIVHKKPAETSGGLQETLTWMEANLHQPLTLEDIAAHAATSVRSLTRRFQEQVGITPMQQVLRLRVQRAQELLETTDIPIEHVSDHVGFGSSVAFRQQFTRRVGVPPQRYRAAFRSPEPIYANS